MKPAKVNPRHYRLNEWHDSRTNESAGFSVERYDGNAWHNVNLIGAGKLFPTRDQAEIARKALIKADRERIF